MKTIALATAAMLIAGTVAAEEICTDSFTQTAKLALRSETFSSELVFKTHDFFMVQGTALVIHPQGNRVSSADITHVLSVSATDGSQTIVTGKITVVEGVLIQQSFCATATEIAL